MQAYLSRKNGTWHLVNSAMDTLCSGTGERILRGSALPLAPGTLFGTWTEDTGVLWTCE